MKRELIFFMKRRRVNMGALHYPIEAAEEWVPYVVWKYLFIGMESTLLGNR
ncbi:hypothetical protein [Halobacillus andaensis]|uniref:hypothetical protein n=1 Tax=Halobacillus andaensis TaxID=1176239 RepID=UPI0016696A29|nr:hypothetical protein [Halobacillus andaensis]MBP2003961.1 hypothetical protein [Halobacillus andaensis]